MFCLHISDFYCFDTLIRHPDDNKKILLHHKSDQG